MLYRRELIKSVHISVNKNEVKYAMDETKHEEPSVTDNSVMTAPNYFKLFDCGKNSWEILMPYMNEHTWQLCMENYIRKRLGMDERAC